KYKVKLEGTGGITASAVAADGKIYFSCENGKVFIVKAGEEYELIAQNTFNDAMLATPAIIQDMIIFRTQKYLIGVGKKTN
ncbi:MAG: hypothetical protein MI922_27660, partial [Bacteroidales bacterium]|nr:hypothetical protein [Bacteroidales bacterium]